MTRVIFFNCQEYFQLTRGVFFPPIAMRFFPNIRTIFNGLEYIQLNTIEVPFSNYEFFFYLKRLIFQIETNVATRKILKTMGNIWMKEKNPK